MPGAKKNYKDTWRPKSKGSEGPKQSKPVPKRLKATKTTRKPGESYTKSRTQMSYGKAKSPSMPTGPRGTVMARERKQTMAKWAGSEGPKRRQPRKKK